MEKPNKDWEMTRKIKLAWMALFFAVLGTAAGVLIAVSLATSGGTQNNGRETSTASGSDASTAVVAATEEADAEPTEDELSAEAAVGSLDGVSSAVDVVEAVLPSVVNVQVQIDTFRGTAEGEGSGVVIDSAGIILTNNHVVEGASRVTVAFNDGVHTEPLAGEVIGTSSQQDLAVIRVDADDLVPIELGSSSDLRLGEPVIALGFPLGLDGGPTVTQGIVSGLDREIDVDLGQSLSELIQTDAAINPGNSGGPLITMDGELVGINTAAASAAYAENIGFAIPIDEAILAAEEIMGIPAAERPWLGVSIVELVSEADATELGFDPDTRGVVIADLVSDGPASTAGLEIGETIVAIAGEQIETYDDLSNALANHDPGDRVDVGLVGGSGERTVSIELGEQQATSG